MTAFPQPRRLSLRPVAVLVGALALTASAAAAASPDVRDAFSDLFHRVGGQTYHEQESPSVFDVNAPAPVVQDASQSPTTPGQDGESNAPVAPVPAPAEGSGQPVDFKEAIALQRGRGLDFPAMAPPGYRPEPLATANAGMPQGISEFRWHDDAGHTVLFATLVRPDGSNAGVFPVGPGSLSEIDVNGNPGVIVRGDWDDRGQWDLEAGVRVRWNKGNAEYEISADDASIPAETLLDMARSAHARMP